ncbi:MAG TPA: glycosyltransferase family 2 protein, partial [Cellulomonas sp.]|nr:glycosyltransferase family 2 protein [Cellulomonas sp.]
MRPTVVIPAHDEQEVVERCLTTLLAEASPQDMRVVVVSNGSTDATVQRARKVAAVSPVQVEVVELARPSKIEAVREGIRRAGGAAVLVLDADIELPTAAALAVLRAMDRPDPVVASA